jgi:hypothetical protein
LGAVVENELDASQLLETLQETSSQQSLSNTTAEAGEVSGFAQCKLVLVVCLNFARFVDNSFVIYMIMELALVFEGTFRIASR